MIRRGPLPYAIPPHSTNQPIHAPQPLAREVDFAAIRTRSPVRLLVSATRVQDGAVRVFRTKAISLDVVLASACLPRLHHAVDIQGEAHWDGGGGFKWLSQHGLCDWIGGTGPEPRQVSSSQGSFAACC